MQKTSIFAISLLFLVFICPWASAQQTLVATQVTGPLKVDGVADEPMWEKAEAIITHDDVADIDVTLKSVYTADTLYFLVTFPDSDQSRLHKPWVWSEKKQLYMMGPEREDCFVIKWALFPGVSDLSLGADSPYEADIWFWKANRTDPAGFADDKMQQLSDSKNKRAKELVSHSGRKMYLVRKGDKGDSAYQSVLYADYVKDMLPQFQSRQPSASRADVQAKGVWQNGRWTIEFMRLLKNNNADDIQFDRKQKYFFGVSRYEIAGRSANPQLSQPLYGSGDVSEKLFLVFE